jgi:hypothetical protein
MVDRRLISEFERSLSSQGVAPLGPFGQTAAWTSANPFNLRVMQPPVPLRCQQNELNVVSKHHEKFVLHCIVTDQLHSIRVFSLVIISRAVVYLSMCYIQFFIARPRFTFDTSLSLTPRRNCE